MTDDIYISKKRLKAHYAWWGETEERKTLDAIVDAQPAADVEEVRRGIWVFVDGYITCNRCGCQPYREHKHIDFNNLYKRCPECGTYMR